MQDARGVAALDRRGTSIIHPGGGAARAAARRADPHRRHGRAVALVLVAWWCLVPGGARAQDGFSRGASGPASQSRPYIAPPPQVQAQPPRAAQAGDSAGEAQDFGVAPTAQLRPSDQLGGPTPTSIPGGKVIATRQLAQLLQGGQGGPMLLHAYASMEHLPGAIAVMPAAQGGTFEDEVQRGFGQYLQQATGGDTSRMLVFYCGGPRCWGSYNASLRAIRLGYRNVHWYRGGLEAWRQAGLQVKTVPVQHGAAP